MIDTLTIRKELDCASPGNRSSNFYYRVFNYGPEGLGLQDKKVLDIGSGKSDFVEATCSRIPGCNAIGIDQSYEVDPPKNKAHKLVGVAQSLPFLTQSFDETLASHILLFMSPESIRETILEMLRVTRDYGRVKIYPVQPFRHTNKLSLPHYSTINYYSPSASDVWYTLDIINLPDIDRITWDKEIEHMLSVLDFQPSIYNYLPARRRTS